MHSIIAHTGIMSEAPMQSSSIGADHDKKQALRQKLTEDSFSRSIALVSVAYVAQNAGFESIQQSAADALVEILEKYVQRIGISAKDNAELAGRAQARATDVMQALHDMIPVPLEVNDLVKALETCKRPFPREIPDFPIQKADANEVVLDQSHIGHCDPLPSNAPTFAPPLPCRQTYSTHKRPVVDREQDSKRTRLTLLEQKNRVQQSLHGLHVAFEKRAAAMHHEPNILNFQNSNITKIGSENPFLQAPALNLALNPRVETENVFQPPLRSFVPVENMAKSSKKLDASYDTTLKTNTPLELGKEEKILAGVFHDGDSE
uniref:Transcription initiation factor TFIID subunit 8 n=1 Tax=Albugo laibachii Nc14 TaxID=890382 RepID=F0WWL9_9STRA|nr:conserved hypothetical protein [Albugo laibachii Nc14]|eukprot:CCA25843.1 conserved hypothetical protein [Albugo laibachii Nc14]